MGSRKGKGDKLRNEGTRMDVEEEKEVGMEEEMRGDWRTCGVRVFLSG